MEASPDGPCEAVVREHLALNLAPQTRRLVRQYAQRAPRPRPYVVRIRVRVFPVRAQTRSRTRIRSSRALQQRPQARQVLRRVHHLHFKFASSTGTMIAIMIVIALLRGGGGGTAETGQDEKVEEGLGVGVKDGERVARVGKVDRRREGGRLQGRVVQFRVGA